MSGKGAKYCFERDEYAPGDTRISNITVGKTYLVRHVSMGTFTARVLRITTGRVQFQIIEGNDRLADWRLEAGNDVDFEKCYFRLQEL